MDPFLKPQKVTREHTFCSMGGKAAAKIFQEESEGWLFEFHFHCILITQSYLQVV